MPPCRFHYTFLAWLPTYFTDTLNLNLSQAAQVRPLDMRKRRLRACIKQLTLSCASLTALTSLSSCLPEFGPTAPSLSACAATTGVDVFCFCLSFCSFSSQVSLAPPIAALAVSAIAGPAADALIEKGVQISKVRKISQCMAFLGPSALLTAASFTDDSWLAVGASCCLVHLDLVMVLTWIAEPCVSGPSTSVICLNTPPWDAAALPTPSVTQCPWISAVRFIQCTIRQHATVCCACTGLITGCLGLASFSLAGLYCNHADLSPRHAPLLLGAHPAGRCLLSACVLATTDEHRSWADPCSWHSCGMCHSLLCLKSSSGVASLAIRFAGAYAQA